MASSEIHPVGHASPPGTKCSAYNCTSRSKKYRNGCSFFRFPKDIERCRQWVISLRRVELADKSVAALHNGHALCEKHFTTSCFGPAGGKKRRLLKNAVPTEELGEQPGDLSVPTVRVGCETSGIKLETIPGSSGDSTLLSTNSVVSASKRKTVEILHKKHLGKSCTDTRWKCAAPHCNKSRSTHPNLRFFNFPVDPRRCQQWLNNIQRVDLKPQQIRGYKLCANHFDRSAFTRLQEGAVPVSIAESSQKDQSDFLTTQSLRLDNLNQNTSSTSQCSTLMTCSHCNGTGKVARPALAEIQEQPNEIKEDNVINDLSSSHDQSLNDCASPQQNLEEDNNNTGEETCGDFGIGENLDEGIKASPSSKIKEEISPHKRKSTKSDGLDSSIKYNSSKVVTGSKVVTDARFQSPQLRKNQWSCPLCDETIVLENITRKNLRFSKVQRHLSTHLYFDIKEGKICLNQTTTVNKINPVQQARDQKEEISSKVNMDVDSKSLEAITYSGQDPMSESGTGLDPYTNTGLVSTSGTYTETGLLSTGMYTDTGHEVVVAPETYYTDTGQVLLSTSETYTSSGQNVMSASASYSAEVGHEIVIKPGTYTAPGSDPESNIKIEVLYINDASETNGDKPLERPIQIEIIPEQTLDIACSSSHVTDGIVAESSYSNSQFGLSDIPGDVKDDSSSVDGIGRKDGNFYNDGKDGTFYSDGKDGSCYSDGKGGTFYSDGKGSTFYSDGKDGTTDRKLKDDIQGCFNSELVCPNDFVFPCNTCGIKFMRSRDINIHMQSVHKDIIAKTNTLKVKKKRKKKDWRKYLKSGHCEICGKVYTNADNLKHHLILHKNKEAYQCDICFKNLQSPKTLRYHKIIHTHGSSDANTLYKNHQDVVCEVCGKLFQFQHLLKKHMKSHNINPADPESSFLCTKCGKSFDNLAGLNMHYARQHQVRLELNDDNGLKVYRNYARSKRRHSAHNTDNEKDSNENRSKEKTCEICQQTFQFPFQLRTHMSSHNGVKPYKCKYCPKMFASKTLRYNHQKIHEEKKVSCDRCPMKFVRRSNMLIHYRTHTGERPFPCQVCGWKFRQQGDMKKHAQKHSEEERLKAMVIGNSGNLVVMSSVKSEDIIAAESLVRIANK